MNCKAHSGELIQEEGLIKQSGQYVDKNPNLPHPRCKSNAKQENGEILPTSAKKESKRYFLGLSLDIIYYNQSYNQPCKRI